MAEANLLRIAILDGDDGSRVGENIEQRVESADVIQQEHGKRDQRIAANLKFLEQAGEVVQRRFALARGSGGEQDETGIAHRDELESQGIVDRAIIGNDVESISFGEADCGLYFGNRLELFTLQRVAASQRHHNAAGIDQRQKERDDLGRIISLDCDHRAAHDVCRREPRLPRLDLIA